MAAAFSPGELEYLLRNQHFRLIYDSNDERAETFDTLCKLGRSLLSGKAPPQELSIVSFSFFILPLSFCIDTNRVITPSPPKMFTARLLGLSCLIAPLF